MIQGPVGSRFTWFTWVLFVCIAFLAVVLMVLIVNRPAHAQSSYEYEQRIDDLERQLDSERDYSRSLEDRYEEAEPCGWNCADEAPRPFLYAPLDGGQARAGLIVPGDIPIVVPFPMRPGRQGIGSLVIP